ncbi:DUF1599 domain-containing protein [Pontibacter sp. G13]|uniref:DUF1599 domain-containing protein n=1 Tax=Pontibacter sp. G13 TaxID=3074898 RepID=UPI00288A7C8B|nr:DUF1599 domain-containing protein [Pontibacter sp. G13]WNJ20854.1 DUF1599 domain-containing protein [Pontibacter sp. G13]
MIDQTTQEYNAVIAQCRDLFLKKAQDYGTSWQILRMPMPSVTDQIYIKAERIRSLQETGQNKVGDSEEGEFVAIINYCVIALLLLDAYEMGGAEIPDGPEQLQIAYDAKVKYAFEIMLAKNHDYGEAWRKMRVSSITDLILMKIFRLKQIEDQSGELLVSEGPDANYVDMLNYAVFCLIKMGFATSASSNTSETSSN